MQIYCYVLIRSLKTFYLNRNRGPDESGIAEVFCKWRWYIMRFVRKGRWLRPMLTFLAALAFGALASVADATGDSSCTAGCPPHVVLRQPDRAPIIRAARFNPLRIEITNWGAPNTYSVIVDCYANNGQSHDGHIVRDNIFLPWGEPKVLRVRWDPWEPGVHGCWVRVYTTLGCHVYSKNALNVRVQPPIS